MTRSRALLPLAAWLLPCQALAISLQPTTMQQVQAVGWPAPCPYGSVTSGSCDAHLERLKLKTVPIPSASPGHAVVQVKASSVNPCDWKTFLARPGPYVPGTDFAGVVMEAGASCGFGVGENVWGIGSATYSEYMVADCSRMGVMPQSFSWGQAGSTAVVGLTGLEALRWAGAPWPADQAPRVLVLGGSSGTGHVGIQLAKAYGAKEIITTCSPDNFDFVRSMGADRAVDYHKENWWEVLPQGSVDVIYDCISLPGTGNHAFDILADGGRFMTLLPEARVSPSVAKEHPNVHQYYFFLSQTSTKEWDMLKAEADQGKLKIVVEVAYHGLDSVATAFNHTMKGHTVGKNAIIVKE